MGSFPIRKVIQIQLGQFLSTSNKWSDGNTYLHILHPPNQLISFRPMLLKPHSSDLALGLGPFKLLALFMRSFPVPFMCAGWNNGIYDISKLFTQKCCIAKMLELEKISFQMWKKVHESDVHKKQAHHWSMWCDSRIWFAFCSRFCSITGSSVKASIL